MTGWGDRLIAGAATLAAVAVGGAALVMLTSFIDPTREGPTSLGLALAWTIGITAMYSPMFAWLGVVLLALLVPWLEKRPKGMFALAGLLMAAPLFPAAASWADQAIRLFIGAAYGEVYRRILAYQTSGKSAFK